MSQYDEAGLAQHPHRMELWGDASVVDFPPLCANCGAPAHKRLTYKKKFLRVYDPGARNALETTTNSWETTTISVPFCDPCIEKHRAEGPGPSVIAIILSRLLSGAHLLGVAGFGIAAAAAGYFAMRKLGQGDLKFFYALAALCGFFLLGVWAVGHALLGGTAQMRVEFQNNITRAFDFSDSTYVPFRAPAFVCTMRNEAFATAFRELNKSQEFDPASPAAQVDRVRAKRKFWITFAVIAAIAVLAQIFGPGK
jgi:hypothetical protein